MAALAVIGFLGLIVCLIMIIVSAIKKNGKVKMWAIGLGACFILFIVGAVNSGSTSDTKTTVATETKQDAPKATEAPKPKEPKWNTKEMYADKNGNVPLAVDLLKTAGDIKAIATTPSPAEVAKAPWNYYGKIVKISGEVGIVQDYPPGSDIAKFMGGNASEIVMVNDDGTIVDFVSSKSSGSIKVGDTVSVYGYPVGLVEVQNQMGGQTTQLMLIGNVAEKE